MTCIGYLPSSTQSTIRRAREDGAQFNDVRFRRAMSLALDGDELNEVYFLGLDRPTAVTIHSTARFYKPHQYSVQRTYPPGPPRPPPAHADRLTVAAIVLPCRLRGFPWRRLG